MDRNPALMYKTVVVGVILLFLGIGIQPAIAIVELKEEIIDVKPKDFLFQTIIDLINNPDINNLLEQSANDLFKVDIDRSVYRKILIRNPRLMFNMFFNKPSMSIEYLNKCYNQGIEITNIIGEDKVLEIIEIVEITDTKLFDELDNIISKDYELSSRLENLKKMNKEINSNKLFWDNYPIICSILLPVLFTFLGACFLWGAIMDIFGEGSIIYYLLTPGIIVLMALFFGTLMFMLFGLECVEYYE